MNMKAKVRVVNHFSSAILLMLRLRAQLPLFLVILYSINVHPN